MSPIKKLKISIRPATAGERIEIHAAERAFFLCSDCHNKYNQFHFYCPQCLGEVRPNHPEQRSLSILSMTKNRLEESAQLLMRLSGNGEFPYQKAFDSLPWIMIADTDATVLAQWREVLETEGMKVAVAPFDPKKRKRFRAAGPLFEKNAPLPCFLAGETIQRVRAIAKTIKNPAISLKWVDAVLTAHRILEGFYMREPGRRILFSDFLFKVEADLQECVKRYDSSYHSREDEFAEQALKLKVGFEAMEAEMEAVRRQVEEQL